MCAFLTTNAELLLKLVFYSVYVALTFFKTLYYVQMPCSCVSMQ